MVTASFLAGKPASEIQKYLDAVAKMAKEEVDVRDAIPTVIWCLDHRDSDIQAQAYAVLAVIGDPVAIPAIKERLNSALDGSVYYRAYKAYKALLEKVTITIGADRLVWLLDFVDQLVRRAAANGEQITRKEYIQLQEIKELLK